MMGPIRYSATETLCVGDEVGGYDQCLHAGGMRSATLTGETSCSGITATDSLGVFNWVCDDSSGTVKIVSDGINSGKGLTDQIDFDNLTWKENILSIARNSCIIASSKSADWGWTNTIAELTGGETLNVAGSIYVIKSDFVGRYVYGADGITILIRPGNFLTITPATDEAILVQGPNFAWFEGEVDGNTERRSIFYRSTAFSVINNSIFRGAGSDNIDLYMSDNLLLQNITVYDGGDCLLINNTRTSTVRDIKCYNGSGLEFDDTGGIGATGNTIINMYISRGDIYFCGLCQDNILHNVAVYNSPGSAVSGFANNVWSQIQMVNSGNIGFLLTSANNGHISHATSVNSSDRGFRFVDDVSTTISQVLSLNNAQHGIDIAGTSNTNIFSNVAISNNGNTGVIGAATAGANIFQELFKVGNNAMDCSFSGAGDQLDGGCNTVNGGTAIVSLGTDASVSIIGKVASDLINNSDSNGTALFDLLMNWLNFDNRFRGWGQGHADLFPSANHQGNCIATETCQIWDMSLASGDSVLLEVVSCPDGNNTLTHTWNVGGTTTHLNHALEIMGDWIGNDNLLCETGETCLYTPNIGAYQGHGSLIDSTCPAVVGTINNIALKQYSINGR